MFMVGEVFPYMYSILLENKQFVVLGGEEIKREERNEKTISV